jgi:hypothetical protein
MSILKKNPNLFNNFFFFIFHIRRKPERVWISYTTASFYGVKPSLQRRYSAAPFSGTPSALVAARYTPP